MLRDDLYTLVSQRLGNRSDLIDRMGTEVQLIQSLTLERNSWLPWFLTNLDTAQVTTVGDSAVPLPLDFLAEDDEQTFWITAEESFPLKKMSYDDMVKRYPGSGVPRAYAQVGEGYVFGPIPDAVYPMTIRYYAADEDLSTNIENKWLKYASDLVAAELGVRMARTHMQYEELAQAITLDARAAWKRLYDVHTAYMENGRERIMEN